MFSFALSVVVHNNDQSEGQLVREKDDRETERRLLFVNMNVFL